MMDAIEAESELERRALEAAEGVVAIGKLTVPRGHQGKAAVNNWIAEMMEIYRKITGSEPATSVGRHNQPNEGVASGPFIRFLQAAAIPSLGLSDAGWVCLQGHRFCFLSEGRGARGEIAGLFKQLSFAGVKLVTLSEGEIGELHVGLKGTMNALF